MGVRSTEPEGVDARSSDVAGKRRWREEGVLGYDFYAETTEVDCEVASASRKQARDKSKGEHRGDRRSPVVRAGRARSAERRARTYQAANC